MSAASSFLATACGAIEAEVFSTFPDTALYRRLCWGGLDRCQDYLHQEFSPVPHVVGKSQNTHTSAQKGSDILPGQEATSTSSPPSHSVPPLKRRRTSLVEELERAIRTLDVVPTENCTYDRPDESTVVDVNNPKTSVVCSPMLKRAPFAVSPQGCTSRVLSAYPCYVLKGYVVLWVETVLSVCCEEQHSATPMSTSITTRALDASRRKKQLSTQNKGKRGASKSSGLGATPPLVGQAAPQELVLHSLHIVDSHIVTSQRFRTYALQSLLQPGVPTALECYPRHMVHFGLLCYAAWHASPEVWEKVGRNTAEQGATLNSSGASSLERVATWAVLLPHTAEDAVLVLGLGGNVLGQCLDAILPSVVPLHLVEFEPAVLQACEEHHQFPPLKGETTPFSGAAQEDAGSRKTPRLLQAFVSKRAKKASASSAPTRFPTVWQEAADAINRKGAESVVFSSSRRARSTLLSASTLSKPISDVAGETTVSTATLGQIADAAIEVSTACKENSPRSTTAALQSAADSSRETPGAYLCVLQDAYSFLKANPQPNKRKKNVSTTATSRKQKQTCQASTEVLDGMAEQGCSFSTPQHSVVSVTSIAPIQYSLIFLDCWDPDREHMMHEGGLIDLCARRLRPGGALLVNAHVLPTDDSVKIDILAHGFATVQALRVESCTQTVFVCIKGDGVIDRRQRSSSNSEEEQRKGKCSRFTLHQLQQLAHQMNTCGAQLPSFADTGGSSGIRHNSHRNLFGSSFRLDASWLRSSRRIAVSVDLEKNGSSEGKGAASAKNAKPATEVDFRVWQHYA